MDAPRVETYQGAPSAWRFMTRAARRAPGLPAGALVPHRGARWTGWRVAPEPYATFCRATGWPADGGVPLLYPQVIGFRLQMAVLTHPAYPLPIWTALQVRNRIVGHRRIEVGERLDFETQVAAQRAVSKGLEVDLVTRLTDGSACIWQGCTTFLHRGRFGLPADPDPEPRSPDLSAARALAHWRMPERGRWAFGRLTGDYNGIHMWNLYARRLGFAQAFAHPQRVAAICQSRLDAPRTEAQRLDLWIKGPVFYGRPVRLDVLGGPDECTFGLALEHDRRHALCGRWQAVALSEPSSGGGPWPSDVQAS